MPALDLIYHAAGCVRRPFFNAASLHDSVRDFYATLLRPHAFSITTEPTEYSAYCCRSCGLDLPAETINAHVARCCPGTRPMRTGPDLRVQLTPQDSPVVIDFTVVHSMAPTNRNKTFEALAESKTKRKISLYKTQVESNDEQFVVLATTAHCRLSAAWKVFNTGISEFIGLARHELESRLAVVIARGVGTTLAAARRRTYWSG